MINSKMVKYGTNRSAIRELFEYGKRRKQEIGNDKVFDFSIGNPSTPCPDKVNETIINLINNKDSVSLHGYTSAQGDLEVRQTIADNLNKTYGVNEDANLIYMTCGAAASISIALTALVSSSEDEIIVFAPYFPEYSVFIEHTGAKKIEAKCTLDKFYPDLKDLCEKITAKTKAIIIDSPNNPTGAVYDEDCIKQLSLLLKQKEEEYGHPIYLISDEPYRELIYNDKPYPFVTKYYDDSLVCYSFSKSLSLPGERIGYILVSSKCNNAKEVYAGINGAGRYLGYVCAPALFQYMIKDNLGITSDLNTYKYNRNLLLKGLTDIGYEVINPDGAFYLFMKCLEDDANKFSKKALEYELLLVPSDSFGVQGYVRISYCVSSSVIENALPAFKKLYDSYKK